MRLRLLSLVVLGASAVTAAMATSCAVADADCTSDGTCPSATSGDGGLGSETSSSGNVAEGGEADAVAPPAGCNASADPKDPNAAPCIDDAFALFVSAGATGGDGTKAKPYGAINDALSAVASSGKHRVYICGSLTYQEHVVVTGANAAWLLGGFNCATWQATTDKPKVLPSDAGYALKVDTVTADFRVEDMAFEAPAATAAKPSSIAVFVASSPNVSFTRVDITAHDGLPGVDGAVGLVGTSTPTDLTGSTTANNTGGAEKSCTCSNGGTSTGGRGGDLLAPNVDGAAGQPTVTPPSSANAGAGGTQAECNSQTGTGRDGSNALPGNDALSPAVGLLTATGWTAGDGATGAPGAVGQGGGGGGSNSVATSGAGGGGGCGGCGGGGGSGGTAGGSSIALASFNSSIQVHSCVLASGKGAGGGGGKAGANGAAGGSHGLGFEEGCSGGFGGKGGAGGAGAGGAGGVSAAVLYSGASPVNDGSTLTPGTFGAGGAGGHPGGNDGPSGKQGTILEAPTP